ncbi:hypothetical protein EAS62_38955, partial [Bradyrhizobium zhanjiangense]
MASPFPKNRSEAPQCVLAMLENPAADGLVLDFTSSAGSSLLAGLRIPRSSRAPYRFDGARGSEMIARSVPSILRAAFRLDRAQFR